MKGRILTAAAAALAASVFVGVQTASALDAPRTLYFRSVTTSESQADVGAKGFGPGDFGTFTERLVNARAQLGKPKGATVGRDAGLFMFMGHGMANLQVTAFLPDGKLVVGGAFRFDAKFNTFPVLGGTGVYANARGYARAPSQGNTVVVHLVPTG